MALIVRLEVDSAVTGDIRQVGVLKITHTEDVKDPEIGNYLFTLQGDAYIRNGVRCTKTVNRVGYVEKHERLKKPAWALVLHALENGLPEYGKTEKNQMLSRLKAIAKQSVCVLDADRASMRFENDITALAYVEAAMQLNGLLAELRQYLVESGICSAESLETQKEKEDRT